MGSFTIEIDCKADFRHKSSVKLYPLKKGDREDLEEFKSVLKEQDLLPSLLVRPVIKALLIIEKEKTESLRINLKP